MTQQGRDFPTSLNDPLTDALTAGPWSHGNAPNTLACIGTRPARA